MPNPEFLARKIQIERWEYRDYLKDKFDVRADSITGRCLKTDGESLSVWKCDDNEQERSNIALALATGTNISSLEGMNIVLLERDDFEYRGFTFADTLGDTRIEDLRERHTDITELNPFKVNQLAIAITLKVRDDECFGFTKGQIKQLIRKAITDGRLDQSKLPKNIQKELSKS